MAVNINLWSREFLTSFIELYKSFPCIWESGKPVDGNARMKREEAYEAMVKKFQEVDPSANKELLIKKLNSFRSTYRKETAKLNMALKAGHSKYRSSIWYYDQLSFLKDRAPTGWSKYYYGLMDSQSNTNEPTTSKDEENESDANRSQSPEEPSAEPKDVNCSVYGKYVATQLQETTKVQRILAERLINEVLFLSRMGKLTETHSIVSRVENSRETNSKIVNNQVETNASSSVTKTSEENKVEPEESYVTKLKKELKTKYSANADQREADAKRAKKTTAATDSRPAPADVPAFLNTKQIFLTEPENPDYLSINGKLVKILKGTDNASYVIINGQPVNLAHLQCTTPSLYLNTLNIEKKKKSVSPPSQPQLDQSQPNLASNIIHPQPNLVPNIIHTQPNLATNILQTQRSSASNIIHTQPNLAPNILQTQPSSALNITQTQPNVAPNIMQNVKFITVPVERSDSDEQITIKDEPIDIEVKLEPMEDPLS